VQTSLSLQWLERDKTAETLGRIIAVGSFVSIVPYGLIWLVTPARVFLSGAALAGISLLLALNVPENPEPGNEVRAGTLLTRPVQRI
jgi:hypothetical protein